MNTTAGLKRLIMRKKKQLAEEFKNQEMVKIDDQQAGKTSNRAKEESPVYPEEPQITISSLDQPSLKLSFPF